MTKAEKNVPEQSAEAYQRTENCSSLKPDVFINTSSMEFQAGMSPQICVLSQPSIIVSDSNKDKPFDILPWLALIVSLGALLYTIYTNNAQRRKSVNDDYWLRTVVFPNILAPLIELGIESPEKFRSSHDLDSFYRSYFLDKMNELRDKSMVLQIVDSSLYREVNGIIDSLDDSLEEATDHESFCHIFGDFSKKLSNALREAQSRI